MISHSHGQTKEIAAEWARDFLAEKADPDQAVVVGLSGHLGSGKTFFTKAVAEAMGVDEDVTSPTFVIMKIYQVDPARLHLPGSTLHRLIHIDAYRLEKGQELEALGFEGLVADPGNLILIEWPENVKEVLPEGTKFVRFEAVGESEREINFSE